MADAAATAFVPECWDCETKGGKCGWCRRLEEQFPDRQPEPDDRAYRWWTSHKLLCWLGGGKLRCADCGRRAITHLELRGDVCNGCYGKRMAASGTLAADERVCVACGGIHVGRYDVCECCITIAVMTRDRWACRDNC